MDEAIRVLLCEDHTLFRELLSMALADIDDIEVVGEASSVEESIDKARDLRPDVVVMDISMGDGSGIDATAHIKQMLPSADVVMITGSEDETDLFESIKAGASGYLLKNVRIEEIPEAIRAANSGTAVISPSIAPKLLAKFAAMSQPQVREPQDIEVHLTERQLDILRLISSGLSDREIGERLSISEGTVRTHVQRILQKFGKESRIEAVLSGVRQGLISA